MIYEYKISFLKKIIISGWSPGETGQNRQQSLEANGANEAIIHVWEKQFVD